jgi:outer membrane autotransporter protein
VNDAVAAQQSGYVAQVQGRVYAALGDNLPGGGLTSPDRGLWGRILGGTAGGDAEGGAPFSADLVGVVVGADLVRAEQFNFGLAGAWVGAWAVGKGALSSSSQHLNSYQITAYGSAAPRSLGGRLSIDGVLSIGFNRYDQERGIDFLHSAARASFGGEQYMASLTAGYAFIGRRVTITPYVGIDEAHLVQHSYTETGAGLADLQVNGSSEDTFRHDIGVKFEGDYELSRGSVMTPSLKLGWGHTYDNGPVSVYSTLAGVTFASQAARPDADGALVGAALVFRRRDRLSFGLEYLGDLRGDFQAHTGAVRLRVRF